MTKFRFRKEKTPYVLENDIKCQIKMTLWKTSMDSKRPRDPSLIWRRQNVNLLIKADKKENDKEPDEQASYDFAEYDSASRNDTSQDASSPDPSTAPTVQQDQTQYSLMVDPEHQAFAY